MTIRLFEYKGNHYLYLGECLIEYHDSGDIKFAEGVKYSKLGNHTADVVRLKVGDEWEPAVFDFQNVVRQSHVKPEGEPNTFVRWKADFDRKFKEVEIKPEPVWLKPFILGVATLMMVAIGALVTAIFTS